LDLNLSQKMSAEALDIHVGTLAEDYKKTLRSLEILNHLVKFCIDINFISFLNGDTLLKEIGNFHAAIAGLANTDKEEVDIRGFFSEYPPIDHHAEPVGEEYFSSIGLSIEDNLGKKGSFDPAPAAVDASIEKSDDLKKETSNPLIKSGMRQIAILDRIRQSGNCRLRDILEILPDASERTIRYDLEDLIERNIIERVGAGGPSVYYRIRQAA